jgi:hypothetical protein
MGEGQQMMQFLTQHWRGILAILIVAQIINAMPSPKETGPTSSWWYQWIFGALHALVNLPRVLFTLFPDSRATSAFGAVFGAPSKPSEMPKPDSAVIPPPKS